MQTLSGNVKDRVQLSETEVKYIDRSQLCNIGVVALSTDLTTERDFARIFPGDAAGVFTTRVLYENPTTPENLLKMAPRISDSVDLLVPGETLSAICYSCTAASVVIGDEAIAQAIHASRPGVPVVTPTMAARLAFKALNVTSLSVLTPYLARTSEPMAQYFSDLGFTVNTLECLGVEDDRDMARISNETIVDAAIRADRPESEAMFISCTALPAVNVIDTIEQALGKPVVSSNQAQAWLAMNRAGLFASAARHVQGYGELFGLEAPES